MKHAPPPAYDLTPAEFEREIADVFTRLAEAKGKHIRAEVLGGAGDDGIDIKLWDDKGLLIAIVQAKRYDPRKAIQPGYLRDLDSCKRRLGVRRAYLVTTGRFSQRVRDQAREWGITLVDGDLFESWRRSARGQVDTPEDRSGFPRVFTRRLLVLLLLLVLTCGVTLYGLNGVLNASQAAPVAPTVISTARPARVITKVKPKSTIKPPIRVTPRKK